MNLTSLVLGSQASPSNPCVQQSLKMSAVEELNVKLPSVWHNAACQAEDIRCDDWDEDVIACTPTAVDGDVLVCTKS